MFPCCCAIKVAEMRSRALSRSEEDRKETEEEIGRKRKRSVFSPTNITCTERNGKKTEEEEDHNHRPTKLKKGMVEWLQHQPLAHQGGVEAKTEDQLPYHQQKGDGRAVGNPDPPMKSSVRPENQQLH